jgi:2-hydroxychromene-2-carboxylate isomerase
VEIAFWFEFASTYSHLSALRIEPLAQDMGIRVVWRPFLLGPIFRTQGWNDSPFNLYPVKGRYMWRDLERLSARDGLPFRRPSVFPRSGLLAARVATAAAAEPWLPRFVRGVYRANFVEDREIADPGVIGGVLHGVGADPDAWLARAEDEATKSRLRAATDEAMNIGIFGAPSFVVAGELFWGNDRLEDALAHALEKRP